MAGLLVLSREKRVLVICYAESKARFPAREKGGGKEKATGFF